MRPIRIRVPATTANLGPGFDCVGMALNLTNDFKITPLPDAARAHEIVGRGTCEGLAGTDNPFFDALNAAAKFAGAKLPKLRVEIDGRIPMARGLGSSATALVAGALAANRLLGDPLSEDDLLLITTREEGHPDNVAPALLGGLVMAADLGERVMTGRMEPHPKWRLVMVIPGYELSTKKAREVLPASITRADAIFNMARIPFLLNVIAEGMPEDLAPLLQDKLHQPHRKKLIKGWSAMMTAAEESGAAGAYLSGAGPTFASFCWGEPAARAVAEALTRAIEPLKFQAEVTILKPANAGAVVK